MLYRVNGIGALYALWYNNVNEAWNVASTNNVSLVGDIEKATPDQQVEIQAAFYRGYLRMQAEQIAERNITIRAFDPAGREVYTYYRKLSPNHFLNKLLCVLNCAIDAQRTANRATPRFRVRIKVEVNQ